MRTPFYPILAIWLFVLACRPAGEGSEQTPGEDSTGTNNPAIKASLLAEVAGCYRMIIKEDTAELRIELRGDSVTGPLFYHWKERHHNDGQIAGIVEDSVLHAIYRFHSEGQISFREVIFKLTKDTLYQAYGEIVPSRDTARFRFREHVIFDRKNPFIRIPCDRAGEVNPN